MLALGRLFRSVKGLPSNWIRAGHRSCLIKKKSERFELWRHFTSRWSMIVRVSLDVNRTVVKFHLM